MSLVAASLWLASCSTGRAPSTPVPTAAGPDLPPDASYKVGTPYQVDGAWYYPSEDYAYAEEGVASWYGPDFHGKRTANGERYDMNALTAAHPTLPMPSVINVTNLNNGRAVKLRVNDRGPFKSKRILDVSRRAAQLLGFYEAGTARVRVEIDAVESLALKNLLIARSPGDMPKVAAAPRAAVSAQSLDVPPGAPAAARPAPPRRTALPPVASQPANVASAPVALPAGTGVYIQAGAFGEQDNAVRLEQQLKDFGNSFIVATTVGNRQLYRVRLGPLQDASAAEELLATIKSYGYDDAVIVRY
ncbi:MAG: septal ring lytic transglycosylase RlpA family protein [Rhodospirillaceae bacterium]|nr:septal ring lytic transglycosylase RlpA family protein [Rhodospirillaceae bacterium]